VHITADQGSAMALFSDGSVWCWGDAQNGECSGLPAFHATPERTPIACASGVTRGGDGGILRRSDGHVAVWSQNLFGQLADGGTPIGTDNAAVVIPSVFDVIQVASAGSAEIALQAGGAVVWWGTLPITEVSTAVQAEPSPMRGLPPIQSISAKDHVCALSKDGQIYCWGNNDFGQLGDGTTDPRASAAVIPTLQNIDTITAGNGFTCAVDQQGTVSCWGLNDHGLLGRGDVLSPPGLAHVHEPLPGIVVGLPPSKAVAAGDGFACALSTDGAVFCWGGVGGVDPSTKLPTSTPFQISGLDSVTELALGTEYLCALRVDHTVWCEGEGFGRGHDGFDLEQLMF
jgi:alpha-tubulin suppressor-like RCC1 family protein